MASYALEHHYQTNYDSTSLGQQKVAIPRLQRIEQGNYGTKERRRVPRACTGVSIEYKSRANVSVQWLAPNVKPCGIVEYRCHLVVRDTLLSW
jgi:hypothetical protein